MRWIAQFLLAQSDKRPGGSRLGLPREVLRAIKMPRATLCDAGNIERPACPN